MKASRAYVVGLSGGIGSGKSAAAERFAALGAAIIDTDAIAHQLTAAGGAAMPAIAHAFGPERVAPDGSLDRAAMRALVFTRPDARRQLEGILHPMIRAESERQIAQAKAVYVILAVPLLIESGNYRERCDRICIVDCPEELQVARVQRRSGLDEQQIRAIMQAQASRTERLAAADDVLDNTGSLAALHEQVDALHQRYLAAAHSTPSV